MLLSFKNTLSYSFATDSLPLCLASSLSVILIPMPKIGHGNEKRHIIFERKVAVANILSKNLMMSFPGKRRTFRKFG